MQRDSGSALWKTQFQTERNLTEIVFIRDGAAKASVRLGLAFLNDIAREPGSADFQLLTYSLPNLSACGALFIAVLSFSSSALF
jgi:hypothetical protein